MPEAKKKPGFDPNAPFEEVNEDGSEKPPFDPNAPFEAVAEDFDPNAPFEPAAPVNQNPNQLQSAISGFASGLTSDYSDEIIARGAAAIKAPFSEETYDELVPQYLAETREHKAAAARENPYTYGGANLVGAVMSPVNKFIGPAKGYSTLKNIGRAGMVGGVMASGASTVDPRQSPEAFGDFLKETGAGAFVGSATQGVLSGVGGVAKALAPEGLKKFARERAVKGATGQNKKVLRQAAQLGQIDKIGDDLLEGAEEVGVKPIVGFGTSVDKIRDRAAAASHAAWDRVEGVYKGIDSRLSNAAISGLEIAQGIMNRARQIVPLPKNQAVIEKMREEAEWIAQHPEITLGKAQELKNNYLFKMADSRTHALGLDGNNGIRAAYEKAITNAVDKYGIAEEKAIYPIAKRLYGSMATAAGAADDRAIANVSNRFISPSDYGVGLMAGMSEMLEGGANRQAEGAITMIATALAHKILRERGSTAAAVSANSLAKLIEKHPQTLNGFRKFLVDAPGQGLGAGVTQSIVGKGPDQMQPRYRFTEE